MARVYVAVGLICGIFLAVGIVAFKSCLAQIRNHLTVYDQLNQLNVLVTFSSQHSDPAFYQYDRRDWSDKQKGPYLATGLKNDLSWYSNRIYGRPEAFNQVYQVVFNIGNYVLDRSKVTPIEVPNDTWVRVVSLIAKNQTIQVIDIRATSIGDAQTSLLKFGTVTGLRYIIADAGQLSSREIGRLKLSSPSICVVEIHDPSLTSFSLEADAHFDHFHGRIYDDAMDE